MDIILDLLIKFDNIFTHILSGKLDKIKIDFNKEKYISKSSLAYGYVKNNDTDEIGLFIFYLGNDQENHQLEELIEKVIKKEKNIQQILTQISLYLSILY
ncbi:MAG: hypothetical protein KAX49_02095 [Halanaerobiales bacterium]|nr:hypothetical protein [Halanaerobiales bacterium]